MRLEFGQSHLTHGGCSRQRRAANRTKASAGSDTGHRHTASPVANKSVTCFEQGAGKSTMGSELTHQQKQGHH